jgi:hypothetical protein
MAHIEAQRRRAVARLGGRGRAGGGTEEDGLPRLSGGKPKYDIAHPNARHTEMNDWERKQGAILPLPVPDSRLVEEVQPAPEKVKADEKTRQRGLDALDDNDDAYDPDIDDYKDIPDRTDYELIGSPYDPPAKRGEPGADRPQPAKVSKKESERQGEMVARVGATSPLVQKIPVRRINNENGNLVINFIKPHYTIILFGRRGSGKTYLAQDILYRMRSQYPMAFVFTRTKLNGVCLFGYGRLNLWQFWNQFVPDKYIHEDLNTNILEKILELQKRNVQMAKADPNHNPNMYALCFVYCLTHADVSFSRIVSTST